VVGTRAFPDHHPFRPAELDDLIGAAARADAMAVTTPKDAVRLPPERRASVAVAGVRLAWADPTQIDAMLATILPPVSAPCAAA
jgi:tetraacyldisaccharide 4'-kinase